MSEVPLVGERTGLAFTIQTAVGFSRPSPPKQINSQFTTTSIEAQSLCTVSCTSCAIKVFGSTLTEIFITRDGAGSSELPDEHPSPPANPSALARPLARAVTP